MNRPLVGDLPKCCFPLKVSETEGNELVEWENWARNQLMSAGSDLVGKFSYLQVGVVLNLSGSLFLLFTFTYLFI